MRVIPVLDLIAGKVVRARFGDRASYRPIETPLAATADPLEVTAGLMALHPFDTVYVADLDGIEGRGRNDHAVDGLTSRWPGLAVWVDNGIADSAEAQAWLTGTRARLVIGSESQTSPALLRALGLQAVLSLDWRGEAFAGPTELLDEVEAWPADVIVMTLARVGGGAGPDLTRLADVLKAAGPSRTVFAAGGVRDLGDLEALANIGIAGALVSTALHDSRLDADALAAAARL